MTDNKKLDLILSKVEKIDKLEIDMESMKTDMQSMKTDMQGMKTDIQDMKTEISGVKLDVKGMKSEIVGLTQRVDNLEGAVRNIRLHLENNTDRNIQLLAENFIELTNKLNQAIPAADKNYAYEVKVNYLIDEVKEMKKRMESEGFVTA